MWDASNGMYNRKSPIKVAIEEAEKSEDCRSKLWLLMDVPWHSRWSKIIRKGRLLVTLISLILLYFETLPAFNEYGPNSRICKQVVNFHCSNVPDTPFERYIRNPMCFNNSATNYNGCRGIQTPSDFSECGFPNKKLGFSCSSNKTVPRAKVHVLVKNWWIEEDVDESQLFEGQIRRTSNYTVRICDRLQCIENGMDDWTLYFQLGETVLVSIFVIELLSRVIASTRPVPLETFKETQIRRSLHFTWSHLLNVACGCTCCSICLCMYDFWYGCCCNCGDKRLKNNEEDDLSISMRFNDRMTSMKYKNDGEKENSNNLEHLVDERHYDEPVIYGLWEWICQVSNQLDTLAVGSAAFEVIWIPYTFGSFRYEVWGFGVTFDPAVFRVIRVLVSARFISMERFFDGTTAIRKTIAAVTIKLLAPVFFLFVFVLIMASLFIWLEVTLSADLFDCDDWDFILTSDRITEDEFQAHCTKCPSLEVIDYSDEFLGVGSRFNGTCRRILIPTDSSSPQRRLEPFVQTFSEAAWFMFVTVTTTGYGRDGLPITYLGRIISCLHQLWVLFILAMPLSVVSSKFFEIFTKMQETKKAKHEEKQKANKLKKIKKRDADMVSGSADNENGERASMESAHFHHSMVTKKLTFRMIVTLKMLARRVRRRSMLRAPLTISQQHLILDYEDQLFVCHEKLWNGGDNNVGIGGSIIQMSKLETLRNLHMRVMYSILRQLGRGDNLHETMRVFHANDPLGRH